MINLRALKRDLLNSWGLNEKNLVIKRKKKMVIEKAKNGDMKLKRKNVIRIEIIE